MSTSPSQSSRYIPVHKRSGSSGGSESPGSSSPVSSTRSLSPTSVHGIVPQMYSLSEMMTLATSPLARLAPETRAALQESVPEIMTNRRQRKAMERNVVPPIDGLSPRGRVAGRVPDRRRTVSKVVEELSWRRRRIAVEQ